MELKKTGDSASIVLIGSFNPQIFHPVWFRQVGLLPATEADNAEVEVVSPDVAIFRLKWLRLEVFRGRFIAHTTDASQFGPLRDLVMGTFSLLEHTPITMMGLNRGIQFDLQDEAKWHQVGHTLAPKEIWRHYLKEPGMQSLSIQAQREDDYQGAINVTVRPVMSKRYVVEVVTNNHYELDQGTLAADAVDIIESCWESALDFALALSEGVIREALASKP